MKETSSVADIPTGLKALRVRNQELLLGELSGDPLSQAELSRRTGLSEATVSNLVTILTAAGEVSVFSGQMNGRRANLVHREPLRATLMIGVHVSRTTIRVAAVAVDGTIVADSEEPRMKDRTYLDELDLISQLIAVARTGEDGAVHEISSIGVGLGVTTDPLTGIPQTGMAAYPYFDAWSGADVAADLAAKYGVSAVALNDADCAALSESTWGAGADVSDLLYVHLSDGVGGGLVLGDRLYRGGEGGFACEIGHLSSDPQGRLCICGNRGCLETVFGDALVRAVSDVHGSDITLAQFAAFALAGDPACSRVMLEAAVRLAAGLANAVALVVPAKVVLGGTLAGAGDALLAPVVEAMKSVGSSHFWRGRVVLGTFGNDSVILGAALAANTQTLQSMKA
jgi:predicted NBD/HSP70 family sugar kinase